MVSVLASMVDHGFEPWLGQIKLQRLQICICCFSAKHAAKLVAQNHNVSEWSYMSTRGLLFQ
jgi:hypothetical protein